MGAVSHKPSSDGWLSPPTTVVGWWAVGLASAAVALGVLGEAARRGDQPGPFYAVAFMTGLFGGVAAILAIRRGERSLLAMLGFIPLLVGVSFGVAELFG